jgi:chemotaxis response regulator CheB
MQWEVKKLPNGKWGIFLCKKYWKFKDKPVMYASSLTEEGAKCRINRMNDPNSYDFDIGYVTAKQAREEERKKKREAKELEKQKKKEARELAKKKRADAAKAKKEAKKK